MVSSKEMSRMTYMVQLVRKNKIMSRRQLILASKVSISYTEKLLPYLPELFTDIVYDKPTLTYQALQTEEV